MDNTPPVITITGQNPATITKGSTYTDAGVTCTDDTDGTISPVTTGSVDASTPGTYTISYSCTDSAGNKATASRTVEVLDTSSQTVDTPPVQQDPVVTITAGSGITEGSTATFTITSSPAPASPITVNIQVSESGDFGATGPATITVTGTTTTYTITTTNDDTDEANGTVTATIQSGNGYTVGGASSASVAVADDDVPPVGNSGTLTAAIKSPIDRVHPGGTLEFTVTLSAEAQQDVTLAVNIDGNGLWHGLDYKVRGLDGYSQLVIGAGKSEGKIYVDILEDAWVREPMLIYVSIELVSGAKDITTSLAHGGINP